MSNGAGESDSPAVDLSGSWRKVDAGAEDLPYPDVLDFTVIEPGAGRYLGRKGRPEQGFLLWDAGTWRLTDDGRIEMSTATDALEAWPVAISDDELHIETAGCVLTYRRATGSDD
ncbi:MAG: hypothetical protein QOG49_484 [Frankiaceae bacterium]|jgi:hypothetical protein|nr:hypothetical protein [Frankiaceae bacterium]